MTVEELLEEEIVALTIWGEGRGEPIEGQIAIANVIKNRVKSGKYANYRAACLAKFQFSCWNENDPNRAKMLKIADQFRIGKVPTDVALKQAYWIAGGIMDGYLKDNTKAAYNYMTKDLFQSTEERPSWADNAKNVIEIGNHTFFTA